jgi:hypothetical protein
MFTPPSEVVPDLSKLAEICPKIHTLSCIPEKCIRYVDPFWEVFGCFWVVQDPPESGKNTPKHNVYKCVDRDCFNSKTPQFLLHHQKLSATQHL